ncbi:hypothetical protein SSX86_032020 [Deinandra increscens subsp. villosa]|uniref:F-box protein n=1 Tax=Deinandra increscens subsp. villosa TaxID=3103831 RepID=A0AAP0C8G7_9ASTR
MDYLNSDVIYDILRRLDGATLATAAFGEIAPNISREWTEAEFYDDYDELESVSPSDFVSIVDIKYKEKTIWSKVLWAIPNADVYNGWFSDCPFRIDLFGYSSRDDDHAGEVTLSVSDGLPPVTSFERERNYGKLWQELHDGIKLSWIVVNSKSKQAANLSSWLAVDGQRHWPTAQDFLLHFGSIVPAKDNIPCQPVKCIITMKFRATHIEGSGAHTTLCLTELCMRLGDIEGGHVNGRNSLFVLKEALSCDRSKDYGLVLESCRLYSRVQGEIKEEKIRHENRLERLYILGVIGTFVLLCCYLW